MPIPAMTAGPLMENSTMRDSWGESTSLLSTASTRRYARDWPSATNRDASVVSLSEDASAAVRTLASPIKEPLL